MSPDHQEINGQVEVTWKTLRNISHSIMVHARVSEEYIYILLMYTTDHVFSVLPIKRLLNQESEPTTPHKLATGSKTPITNLRALLYL